MGGNYEHREQTSNKLLTFYLNGLEKWQGEEYWHQAREIRARAIAEDRLLTPWEDQQGLSNNRRTEEAIDEAL
ncbi:MAG TPA: hypothetical protein VN875_04280 [Candidatus Binatus sp.]|jgi:hypothetical protein|nr:hypothetical protein [Candidatus Binatus sp.]